MSKKHAIQSLLAASLTVCTLASAQDRQVNIYNWSDYIGETTLSDFQEETGITAIYDVFDSNETLEAKLLTGQTGYDIVVPSNNFVERQINAGAFAPINPELLPNITNLDPVIMARLADNDPGNQYAVPYMWGTSGIAYNKKKIKEILGVEKIDSWSALFDPDTVKKLSACGVALMDSPDEVYAPVLNYIGKNPNSKELEDYQEALNVLEQVRPYITYFHSSKYISDLANGNICIAMAHSGDGIQAMMRAEEAGNDPIEYVVPKEGGNLWFDVLAIPADATHKEEAHAFINFLLDPHNIALISNYTGYANPNPAATPYVDEELVNNPAVYPDAEIMEHLYVSTELGRPILRWMTRSWSTLKSGR